MLDEELDPNGGPAIMAFIALCIFVVNCGVCGAYCILRRHRDALRESQEGDLHENPEESTPDQLEHAELHYRTLAKGRETSRGPDHPDTLDCLAHLADLVKAQGRLDEAEELYRQVLKSREQSLGPEHSDTLKSNYGLSMLLCARGRAEEAEELRRDALAIREKRLGPEHPDTMQSVNNLAVLLRDQGKLEEAEALFRRALAGRERTLEREHTGILQSEHGLATVLHDQGKLKEAEPLYRKALEGRAKKFGRLDAGTLKTIIKLATLLEARGSLDEAERLYRLALGACETKLGPDHIETLRNVENVARVLEAQGKLKDAEPLYRRSLAGHGKILGPDDPETVKRESTLESLLRLQPVEGGSGACELPEERRASDGWATPGPVLIEKPPWLDKIPLVDEEHQRQRGQVLSRPENGQAVSSDDRGDRIQKIVGVLDLAGANADAYAKEEPWCWCCTRPLSDHQSQWDTPGRNLSPLVMKKAQVPDSVSPRSSQWGDSQADSVSWHSDDSAYQEDRPVKRGVDPEKRSLAPLLEGSGEATVVTNV